MRFALFALPLALLGTPALADCAPCGGSLARDACVAGTWTATGNGPADWMRARGIPLRDVRVSPQIMSFNADGTYASQPFSVDFTMDTGGMEAAGNGVMTAGSGCWSAEAGQLNICPVAGGMLTITVTVAGVTQTMPAPIDPNQPSSLAYSCDAVGLRTENPVPGDAPVITQMVRME